MSLMVASVNHICRKHLLVKTLRTLSTAADPVEKICPFRTSESNPANHSLSQEGLFYKIPDNDFNRLFAVSGWKKWQKDAFHRLDERAIMIRKPALEIINYLKQTDYSRPANRYLLWGKSGHGKTFTLNHLIHFVSQDPQWMIVHVDHNMSAWFDHIIGEISPSESRPGMYDLPMEAALWLQQFRVQNAVILSKLNLTASEKYTWSLRETTEVGDPLMNVIEHGIQRMKHASDCMAVLLKELKRQANEGKFKLFVAINLVNSLYRRTNRFKEDAKVLEVNEVTMAKAIRKICRNDWKNGAVVGVVSSRPYLKATRRGDNWRWYGIPDTPFALLKEDGMADFDPFIPVFVDKYSDKELDSAIDYYIDRQLVTRPVTKTPAGKQELRWLSAHSPLDLYKLCLPR